MWKRSGAWFFKGFPKHFLPSPMPLSKSRETGAQETAEPQGAPASEPREAVTQPQPPGRHSPHAVFSVIIQFYACQHAGPCYSIQLTDCFHKQWVHLMSLFRDRLLPLSSKLQASFSNLEIFRKGSARLPDLHVRFKFLNAACCLNQNELYFQINTILQV